MMEQSDVVKQSDGAQYAQLASKTFKHDIVHVTEIRIARERPQNWAMDSSMTTTAQPQQ